MKRQTSPGCKRGHGCSPKDTIQKDYCTNGPEYDNNSEAKCSLCTVCPEIEGANSTGKGFL